MSDLWVNVLVVLLFVLIGGFFAAAEPHAFFPSALETRFGPRNSGSNKFQFRSCASGNKVSL